MKGNNLAYIGSGGRHNVYLDDSMGNVITIPNYIIRSFMGDAWIHADNEDIILFIAPIPTMTCTHEDMPVCGTDGKTYPNIYESKATAAIVDYSGQRLAYTPTQIDKDHITKVFNWIQTITGNYQPRKDVINEKI